MEFRRVLFRSGSLASPLWATTAFSSTDPGDAAKAAGSTRPQRFYTRYGNPTINAFEEAVAALEGAESALAFGSGMGAIASTVMALCSQGDHIVAQRQLYGGTLFFLQTVCPRFGIEVSLVPLEWNTVSRSLGARLVRSSSLNAVVGMAGIPCQSSSESGVTPRVSQSRR